MAYPNKAHGNRQSKIRIPTRYRVVVLTSCHSVNGNDLKPLRTKTKGKLAAQKRIPYTSK